MKKVNLMNKKSHLYNLFVSLLLISLSSNLMAQEKELMPCMDNAKYQEFDFWLGSWNVFDAKGNKQGSNVIEKIYNGCLITENWTSINNTPGYSMNYYNPVTDKWAQRWVSAGTIIEYEGGLKEGAMVLEGTIYYHKSVESAAFKGTWSLLEDGRVRQFFEQYSKKESTWKTWFDGYYVKIKD